MSLLARKNPTLPQDDSPAEREKRDKQIAETRVTYQWTDTMPNVVGVPMATDVPEQDQPTLQWYLKVIEAALAIVENVLANIAHKDNEHVSTLLTIKDKLHKLKAAHETHDHSSVLSWVLDKINEMKVVIASDIGGGRQELEKLVKLLQEDVTEAVIGTDTGLSAYKNLFQTDTVSLDPLAENFQNDEVFAYFRLGGPNPMLIKRIDALPAHFAVTEAGFQQAMGRSDSLQQAFSDKRVFLLDYKELQLLVDNPGFTDGQPKQLFAPLALFALTPDKKTFLPVAIQRAQEVDEAGIVYPQNDEALPGYWEWHTAKSIVQMAEGNYHELFVHLARTHLLIEAFKVATCRNLAQAHPLNALLMPHFEGTLFINNAAATSLIAEGGPIDSIFAAEISKTQLAAGTDRLDYDFYDNMLPTDLKNRKVDDPNILPNFPYRDDALLVWDSIATWVSEYVNIYYENDDAVVGDTELAAWAAELIIEGKVKGFKTIKGKAQLKDVLTMVIFTSSAQHAAVNFPQRPYMSYAPAISGALWGPKPPKGNNEASWLETLPPLKQAFQQLNTLFLLGSVYYRELGEYRTNDFPYLPWFQDEKIIAPGNALDRFQSSLKQVEATINERNKERNIPYTFLAPTKIPMSINI